MSGDFRKPKGTYDMLPEAVPERRRLEEIARRVSEAAGYGEIRTPVFEYTSLFVRGVGEATDIVDKEMFTIPPRGDDAGEKDSLTLRPELTASVVRSYVENQLFKSIPFQKFYYTGPLFRAERPQKGRFRQFYQYGVEVIGSDDPLQDVETILLADRFFRECGVKDVELKINSTGCPDCRPGYRDTLKEYFAPHLAEMCDNCRNRVDRNVFRVLDCKKRDCRPFINEAPSIESSLCETCTSQFAAVKCGLDAADRSYAVEPTLVRGLDYYTRTVFEFTAGGLGAQNAICGGGRYDNLVEELGGPSLPAVGFAIGLERIELVLKAQGQEPAAPIRPGLYVVTFDESVRDTAFRLVNILRNRGIPADMDFEGRSVRSQMRVANRIQARYTVVLGPDEVESGQVTVKDMDGGNPAEISMEELEASWSPES